MVFPDFPRFNKCGIKEKPPKQRTREMPTTCALIEDEASIAMESDHLYYSSMSWSRSVIRDFCRICANPKNCLIPIFEDEGLEQEIRMKIEKYLPIKVAENDRLPVQVCESCVSTVSAWHSFISDCLAAELKLKALASVGSDKVYEHMPQVRGLGRMKDDPFETVDALSFNENLSEDPLLTTEEEDDRARNRYREYENVVEMDEDPESQNDEAPDTVEGEEDGAVNDNNYSSSSSDLSAHSSYSNEQVNRSKEVLIKHLKRSILSVKEQVANALICLNERTQEIQDSPPSKKTSQLSCSPSSSLQHEKTEMPGMELLCRKMQKACTNSVLKEAPHKISYSSSTIDSSDDENRSVEDESLECFSGEVKCEIDILDHSLDSETLETIKEEGAGGVDSEQVPIESTSFADVDPSCSSTLSIIDTNEINLDPSGISDYLPSPSDFPDKKENLVSPDKKETSFGFDEIYPNVGKVDTFDHSYFKVPETRTPIAIAPKVIEEPVPNSKPCLIFISLQNNNQSLVRLEPVKKPTPTAYKCNLCGEVLRSAIDLRCHKLAAHCPVKCPRCGVYVKDRAALLLHEKSHVSAVEIFVCRVCTRMCRTLAALKTHMLCHKSENILWCSVCVEVFSNKDDLKAHQISHTKKFFLCEICGKSCNTTSNFQQHIRTHLDDSVARIFTCNICNKTFRTKANLRNHNFTHASEKMFVCEICGKSFYKRALLRLHSQSHSELRPFKCNICGIGFKWKKNLRQHASVHNNAAGKPCPRVPCDLCGKVISKMNMSVHKKRHNMIAQDVPPCVVCGKKLTTVQSLERHVKLHQGLRLFMCDICGKDFSARVSLNDHRRIHTGEKPYECLVCKKLFATRTLLYTHRKVHMDARPYACTFCDKKFKRRPHLLVHIRTHTGEKPYLCHVCSRGFAQKNDMLKHLVVHSSEKPFVCDCGLSFRQKKYMQQHRKKHTESLVPLSEKDQLVDIVE